MNIETRKKISDTLRKRHATGELHVWCEGKKNIKLSILMKNAYKNGIRTHHNLGKKFSKELREKLSKAHIGLQRGVNSGSWKGGVTPETNNRISQIWWKLLRKLIYLRDNWTCQMCQKHGGELACHHIIPFTVGRYNGPKNLVTLCNKCHPAVEAHWENFLWLKDIAEKRTTINLEYDYFNLLNKYIFIRK